MDERSWPSTLRRRQYALPRGFYQTCIPTNLVCLVFPEDACALASSWPDAIETKRGIIQRQ